MADNVNKSESEWKELLTPLSFHVTRQSGTERAFTGKYYFENPIGRYRCICCKTELFHSDAKFDAGCGWPSFFKPTDDLCLVEIVDRSHGMVRTEVRCKTCDAHLGHVFPDGPKPTGLRYCINSVAIVAEQDL